MAVEAIKKMLPPCHTHLRIDNSYVSIIMAFRSDEIAHSCSKAFEEVGVPRVSVCLRQKGSYALQYMRIFLCPDL